MLRIRVLWPLCMLAIALRQSVVVRRMRKDPLDPIDNGTKVALAFRRVTNPKAVADEVKRKKEEQAAAKQAGAPAKAGAWSGLPGR